MVEAGRITVGVNGLVVGQTAPSRAPLAAAGSRGLKRPRPRDAAAQPSPTTPGTTAAPAAPANQTPNYNTAEPPVRGQHAVQGRGVRNTGVPPASSSSSSGLGLHGTISSTTSSSPAAATASGGHSSIFGLHSGQIAAHGSESSSGDSLNAEQQQILDAVLSGQSVFFTGSAGTGKSFLLRHCIERLLDSGRVTREQIFVTAATGIAAVNIGGTTFHSFSGLGLAQGSLPALITKVQASSAATERWRRARVLVLDEISMLDGRLLDSAEAVARAIRRSSAPFGGLQLLLSGDFFQLPPVGVNKRKAAHATAERGAPAPAAVKFAFQADCWPKVVTQSIMLSQVYRQKDNTLRDILNRIRVGKCEPDDCRVLTGARPAGGCLAVQAGVQPTELCALNRHVAERNSRSMGGLKGEKHRFTAHMEGSEYHRKQLQASCTADAELVLCAGAQVVLLKNLEPEVGLVNGARGTVYDFVRNRDSSWPPLLPRVVFCPPGRAPTKPREVPADAWSIQAGAETKATMTQVPLKLAYALSIHKSQGMTIDSLVVDLRGVFEYGQAYVALSRGVSLDRMTVRNFSPACVKAHPDVVKFYEGLACASRRSGCALLPRDAPAAARQETAVRQQTIHTEAKDEPSAAQAAAEMLEGLDFSDIFGDL